jgi:heme-degrading monooxygenase HmoA
MGRAAAEEGGVMILEIAQLQIRPGRTAQFEAAFAQAQTIIASMQGYRGHELQHCVENDHQYMLLVRWDQLEDHTVGFRQSAQYQEWRALLHHFYDPFPTVLHYSAAELQ